MADAVWLESGDDERARTRSRSLALALALPLPVVTGGVAFLVYLGTVGPTIGFLDSPELSAAALSLGVPHPTGYPLFMMLGHVFSLLLFFGDPAWRLNVFSALLASVGVGFTAAFAARLTGRPLSGWIAGLALAFSPAFWMQATLLEVYGLHVALLAALLYFWLRYEQQRQPAVLRRLTFTAGLALTHHLMSLLALPVIAIALAKHVNRFARPRELARLVALGVAPLFLLAYLPWAAARNPVVNWGDPTSPRRFLSHITGMQYHGLVAGNEGGAAFFELFARLWEIAQGLTPALVILVLLGVWRVRAATNAKNTVDPHERSVEMWASILLLALFTVGVGFGVLYGAVDREPFFLNALLIAAIWAGVGAARARDLLVAKWPERERLATFGLALLPIIPLLANAAEQDRSSDYEAHDSAMAALTALPHDAILLVQGPYGYPPIYASLIAGIRPDVLVVDQHLRVRGNGGGYGPELEAMRYRPGYDPKTFDLEVARVASQLGRPLFVAPLAPELSWSEIDLVRVRAGALDRLVPSGTTREQLHHHLPVARADTSVAARFGSGLMLTAAEIGVHDAERGDVIPVTLSWRDERPRPAAELIVTLTGGDAEGWMIEDEQGEPLLSFNFPLGHQLPTDTEFASEWSETIHLVAPRGLPEGPLTLYIGVLEGETFLPTAAARAFVPLGEVSIMPRQRPLWTVAPANADRLSRRIAAPPGDRDGSRRGP